MPTPSKSGIDKKHSNSGSGAKIKSPASPYTVKPGGKSSGKG